MPWPRSSLRAIVVVVAAAALVVAYWWWQGRARPALTVPPPSSSSTATPRVTAEAPPDLVVHVIGKVRHPGVVELPEGSRVVDAIEAAGGLRDDAHLGDLNLARVLVDGEQVAVGIKQAPSSSTDTGGTTSSGGPLDLNTATAAQLEDLPGVGPVLAERIIAWREANGPFAAVDILGEVAGIGDVLLENLRPLVRV